MKSRNFLVIIALLTIVLITVSACRALRQAVPVLFPISAPKFEITSLNITPPEVTVGKIVNITAEVRNTGASDGTCTTILNVDDVEVERKDITVAAGTIETVTFSLIKDAPGAYKIGIKILGENGEELDSILTVKEKLDLGRVMKIEPTPEKGFYWAYYLYIPYSVRDLVKENKSTFLLVEPNNTGRPSDDQEIHDSAARVLAEQRSLLAEDLSVPLLVPTFPRPDKIGWLYTHALDRDTLLIKERELKRIDLQLLSMIDDAMEKLSRNGINLEEKVLMIGFSASGMFVNRFAILHPEKVQAAAIGAPGGWPIVPVKEWNGKKLRYPIGVWDLEELVQQKFDLESFKSVPLYFYMGDRDTNDSVIYRDGYDLEDEQLIFETFGSNPVERWPIAEEIYKSVGSSSQFVLYPGVGHCLTGEMLEDIKTFFLNTH